MSSQATSEEDLASGLIQTPQQTLHKVRAGKFWIHPGPPISLSTDNTVCITPNVRRAQNSIRRSSPHRNTRHRPGLGSSRMAPLRAVCHRTSRTRHRFRTNILQVWFRMSVDAEQTHAHHGTNTNPSKTNPSRSNNPQDNADLVTSLEQTLHPSIHCLGLICARSPTPRPADLRKTFHMTCAVHLPIWALV